MSIKAHIKNTVCSLPLPVKKGIGRIKTRMDAQKTEILRSIDGYHSDSFPSLNQPTYKQNLAKCLELMLYSAQDTKEYLDALYNHEFILENEGSYDPSRPTIICVAKNELDKLVHFFEHYNRIGHFNYIFVDNHSSDDSVVFLKQQHARVYSCAHPYCTIRRVAWVNRIFSTLPDGAWVLFLDADELLTYHDYESVSFDTILSHLSKKHLSAGGAVMVDMFSPVLQKEKPYYETYTHFQNVFHREKSFYFRSIYGGIRERAFNTSHDRLFLLHKIPLVRKTAHTFFIHSHYTYPFEYNFSAPLCFALLHYKLFDRELAKYSQIASSGSYANGSEEYHSYVNSINNQSYETLFAPDSNTLKFSGTDSLKKIRVLTSPMDL